jgi:predicted kinase
MIKDDRKPNLILMAGYPGVGKSVIAVKLAKALGYPLLDNDDILAEVDALSGIEGRELKGRLAYNILKALVVQQIQLGVSVVVDTPLTHQWLRDFMFALAERHGAKAYVVYCHCPDHVAIERNRLRLVREPVRYSDRDSDNFHRIKGLFRPIAPIASISVDTEEPIDTNVARILEYLKF